MHSQASRLAQVNNYYPECVSIEIESCADAAGDGRRQYYYDNLFKGIGKSKRLERSKEDPLGFENIFLSICFAQQEERVFGGSLLFGLRKARLGFYLRGAEMRIKHRYGKDFSASESIEVTTEVLSEKQGGAKLSIKDPLGSEGSISSKESEKKTFKDKQLIHKIQAVGHKDSPAWIFEEPDNQKMLDGMIKELKIGTLTLCRAKWLLSFELTFSISDIYLRGSGGLWIRNLSKNKLAIIERKLAKTLLSRRIISPICEGRLSP